jgi:phosphocarrier protein HPr
MMSEKKIRLNRIQDVREFVSTAERCDFDIDISYNRIIIDAKSIMGVLSMDLTQVLTVKYGGRDPQFENILNKYAAA